MPDAVRAAPTPQGREIAGARRRLDLRQPAVMGILNVTPDSFSDGGRYLDPARAVAHALDMVEAGARLIDIGGESTRPGAAPVPLEEELARILPVVEGIRAESDIFLSVDTGRPDVMRAACAAGADMINDVRGLRAAGALAAVAETGAAACLMHMQGDPATMQVAPRYDDVIADVGAFLDERVAACIAAGIDASRLIVDPGFGFGKTLDHNLELLRGVGRFVRGGQPVLIGVSRKSMFAKLFACDDMAARINGSLGAAFWAVQQGVSIVRTHDVRETAQMLLLARSLTADNKD